MENLKYRQAVTKIKIDGAGAVAVKQCANQSYGSWLYLRGIRESEFLIYYACCCVILPNKVWQYKPSAMSFKCVTLYQFLNYNFGIAYFKAAVVLTIVG